MIEKCCLGWFLPSSLNEIMWELFTFAGGLVFMKEKRGGLYHFPFFRLPYKFRCTSNQEATEGGGRGDKRLVFFLFLNPSFHPPSPLPSPSSKPNV